MLGEIKDGELQLFESGNMIISERLDLENIYENIILHDFVVISNHFHGIIEIIDDGNDVNNKTGTHKGHPYGNNDDFTNVGVIPCGCQKNGFSKIYLPKNIEI